MSALVMKMKDITIKIRQTDFNLCHRTAGVIKQCAVQSSNCYKVTKVSLSHFKMWRDHHSVHNIIPEITDKIEKMIVEYSLRGCTAMQFREGRKAQPQASGGFLLAYSSIPKIEVTCSSNDCLLPIYTAVQPARQYSSSHCHEILKSNCSYIM
jgi:hypothetical protein